MVRCGDTQTPPQDSAPFPRVSVCSAITWGSQDDVEPTGAPGMDPRPWETQKEVAPDHATESGL